MNWSLILGIAIGVGVVVAGLILFGAHLYNESAEAEARREHQAAVAARHKEVERERKQYELHTRARQKADNTLQFRTKGGTPAA